ncbi:uncharacterized protein [Aegilops tauschii subsp. strangulata]|uniref:uncharacterized protein n=1 Tax=Aegilops tauschii subsp. strangulata TaxID=200361 RepID=UPI003CC86938
MSMSLDVLVWNVRGLNNPARRSAVRLFVQSLNVSLVCFQESKLALVNDVVVRETLGPAFDGFDFLPAEGTRGGILLAWKSDMLRVTNIQKDEFMILAQILSLAEGKEWLVSSVYGPQEDTEKARFLKAIVQFGDQVRLPWILNGDFNIVCNPDERSSGRVNRRPMNKFRHKINRLGLHDMPLIRRRFSWCNQQEHAILARLDCVLFNNAWEDLYPISDLLSLSSNISDHTPLLLTCSFTRPRAYRFRFENYWCKMPGFMDVVKDAWTQEVWGSDPMKIFNIKLHRTAKALRSWGQRSMSHLRLQFQVASEVILRLDSAQERRPLSSEEKKLRAFLRGKCPAFASLERVRLRQRARVQDLREGDANSRYFHMKANGRRRKHLIPYSSMGIEQPQPWKTN